MVRLCHESTVPRRLAPADLEAALGEPVRQLSLWRANWRNRVYRIEGGDGRALVAKQLCVTAGVQVQCEYDQLAQLAGLEIPELRVPRQVIMLPEHRAYAMELVPGQTLQGLFREAPQRADLPQACALAGRVLGRLHRAWTVGVHAVPVQDLAHDLAQLPGGFRRRQWRIVQDSLEALAAQEVGIGRLYLDFKASNLLYHRDALTLLDPPPVLRQGIQLWDYATFRSSLLWQLWKALAVRPMRGARALVTQSLSAFEQAYQDQYAPARLSSSALALLVRLLELQQVGQLLAFQVGKLRLLGRPSSPLLLSGQGVREIFSTLAWLPALQLRKQCLIDQLGRLLAAAACEPVPPVHEADLNGAAACCAGDCLATPLAER